MAGEKLEQGITFTPAKVYLVLYNFFQALGWCIIFAVLVAQVLIEETHVGVYEAEKRLLYIFQTGAILEVLHAILGLVRSNWVLTAFQVESRVFLLWGVTYSVPQVQDSIGVPVLLLAWSITEIIRYSYYTFGLLGNVPKLLTWCRYTFFIVLYPVGVTGELTCIYLALPHVLRSGLYSYPMPNVLNMSFSYHTWLVITMMSYIPIFPQLYLHMFAQRRKILSGRTKRD